MAALQALQEHISRNALRVKLLRDVDFVGGKVVRAASSKIHPTNTPAQPPCMTACIPPGLA